MSKWFGSWIAVYCETKRLNESKCMCDFSVSVSVSVSQRPSVPASQRPSVPVSQCPSVPVSQCPSPSLSLSLSLSVSLSFECKAMGLKHSLSYLFAMTMYLATMMRGSILHERHMNCARMFPRCTGCSCLVSSLQVVCRLSALVRARGTQQSYPHQPSGCDPHLSLKNYCVCMFQHRSLKRYLNLQWCG